MTKKYSIIFCIILLMSSCASKPKYGLVVGGGQVTYDESGDARPLTSNTSVTLPNIELKTNNIFIGISEELPNVLTKIQFHKANYPEKDYTVNNTTSRVSLDETQIRATIAFKLGFFQPYLSVTRYGATVKVDEKETESSYNALGYGFDLEMKLNKKSRLFIGYGKDSHEQSTFQGVIKLDQEFTHDRVYLGYRYNFSGSSK